MQIAYTGWTWLVHHEDNYRFEFEQFLKAMRDLGYPSSSAISTATPTPSPRCCKNTA